MGTALVAASAPPMVLLHVLPPSNQVNPLTRTISEYALGANGWLFDLSVLALAAGSLIIALALVRLGVLGAFSPATVLLLAWTAGLTVLVVFEKHNWQVGASSGGQIHRVASLVAFLSLPAAALFAARAGRLRPEWQRAAVWTRRSALLAVAALTPLFYAVAVNIVTGQRWWRVFPLGVVERLLAVSEVVVMIALGAWAIRAHRADPSPAPSPASSPGLEPAPAT